MKALWKSCMSWPINGLSVLKSWGKLHMTSEPSLKKKKKNPQTFNGSLSVELEVQFPCLTLIPTYSIISFLSFCFDEP
jgi:hypothetical protein